MAGISVAPARHPALRASWKIPLFGRQAHGAHGVCGEAVVPGPTQAPPLCPRAWAQGPRPASPPRPFLQTVLVPASRVAVRARLCTTWESPFTQRTVWKLLCTWRSRLGGVHVIPHLGPMRDGNSCWALVLTSPNEALFGFSPGCLDPLGTWFQNYGTCSMGGCEPDFTECIDLPLDKHHFTGRKYFLFVSLSAPLQ